MLPNFTYLLQGDFPKCRTQKRPCRVVKLGTIAQVWNASWQFAVSKNMNSRCTDLSKTSWDCRQGTAGAAKRDIGFTTF